MEKKINQVDFTKITTNTIIFIEKQWSNLNTLIFDFIKNKCCNQDDNFCNKCIVCEKINRRQYYDLKILDSYKNNVKKEEVLDIQNDFLYTGLELWQKKICLIYGLENLNNFVYNSLLKMLEQANENTFFIFTTRNIYRVPQTIKSRCQLIYSMEEKEKSINELKEIISNEMELKNILNTYYSIEDFFEDFNNGTYEKVKTLSDNILKSKNKENEIKEILMDFKKMDTNEIEKIFLLLMNNIDIKDKQKYIQSINDLKFIINKTLIFNKLLSFVHK